MALLTKPTTRTTNQECTYQRAINQLTQHPSYDDADAALITDWNNGHESAARIAHTLRTAGLNTSATVIKDHRRGECICTVNN